MALGNLEKELVLARSVARECSEILKKFALLPLEVADKGYGMGLVTQADRQSEAHAVGRIKEAFPEDSILGEESGAHQKDSDRVWIIDPLDGTTNFVHRFPFFGVSIGLAIKGIPVLGVIQAPMLGVTWWGSLGNGAFVEQAEGTPRSMKVGARSQLADSLLCTGFCLKEEFVLQEVELFKKVISQARAIRRPGAAALDLGYIAQGVFDGFWERELAPWDVTAGAAIIKEAGGVVVNEKGAPWSTSDSWVIAGNPLIAEKLRKILVGGGDD